MKAKVYTVADVKISRKGDPYCIFAIQAARNKIYKVLAFKDLAQKCSIIDRVGEEIICDGNIQQEKGSNDEVIFLETFVLPERKSIKTNQSPGEFKGTSQRPFKLWTDDNGYAWVRYLKEGEPGAYEI